MRASNYYRAAEFYLHGDPADPRITELSSKGVELFRKALTCEEVRVEMVDIPYEGTTLPGYFYPCDATGEPRPTLILQTGFDGTQEELYLGGVTAATRRGFHCLTFEGPGQGRVIREQGLPFRVDWEKVVTPVVDYALSRPEVQADKIALEGVSFGGYMAPRAAAFEHRLAACIANGGVYDFMGSHVPEGMERDQFFDLIRQDTAGFDKGMFEMMKTNTDMRWSITNGMFTFGVDSPGEWMLKASEYNLGGVADKVKCPTLVIDVENELNFTGQAKLLYDALTYPKTWMLFTIEEGAEEHCQIGAALLSAQRIFDWLEDTFS
jgi:pimeloyl-ACP methyl ester carboxylesterase